MMTKAELKTALEQTLQDYRKDAESVAADPYSEEPATQGQLFEAQRQVFYALDNFKKNLLDYLD